MKTVSSIHPVSTLATAYTNGVRFMACNILSAEYPKDYALTDVWSVSRYGKLYPACPPSLSQASLDGVEYHYKQGLISYAELVQYLRAWNGSGTKFTRAIWQDGAIRQFDPENGVSYSAEILNEFGADV